MKLIGRLLLTLVTLEAWRELLEALGGPLYPGSLGSLQAGLVAILTVITLLAWLPTNKHD